MFSPGGFCHFEVGKGAPDTSFLERKRRRGKLPPPSGADAPQSRGTNGRAILLHDPCVFVGHLDAASAVLLEKPWADVTQGFAPPLYKHRYGA